ncbi:MAG: hypothetical protein Q4E75_02765 [bacterium]|nr:hypothetical protein [bacterium]
MIELRSYFCQTYYKHEYYVHKFQDLLTWKGDFDELWIYDEQDAIEKFKELIQPYNSKNPMIDTENDNNFIYLCNYLNDIGYYIEEFPTFLERPTERWDLSYDKVRKKIIERDGYSGKVAWADRSVFVENLKFIKKDKHEISDDVARTLKNVSTRSAEFNNMTFDEQLEAICNSIEYLLKPHKKSDKFIVLDYSDTEGYLSDEVVKDYRNKLECFRHSTKDDLSKRKNYTDEQKDFLISYGLVIIDYVSKKTNNNLGGNI